MHLLIPYANSLADPARALWPTLALPHLQTLLGRLARQPADRTPQADRSLNMPHERKLAELLGLPADDGRIPWAAWQQWQDGEATPSESDATPRASLMLCHWQVTTQQVLLQHPDALALTPQENAALLTTLSDFFRDDGIALAAGQRPGHWMASGELLRDLPCASLDRLLGPDVDAALLGQAGSAAARTVRRLQNETQMLLYTHAVNEARENRGELTVNAFVLTGAGAWQPPPAYDPPALIHGAGADEDLLPPQPGTVVQIDSLREAALRGDWYAWAAAWQAIDRQLARPEWTAASRHIGFELTLCGDEASQTWRGQAQSGWAALLHRFKGNKAAAAELDCLRQL